jgi:hypothetical protein
MFSVNICITSWQTVVLEETDYPEKSAILRQVTTQRCYGIYIGKYLDVTECKGKYLDVTEYIGKYLDVTEYIYR